MESIRLGCRVRISSLSDSVVEDFRFLIDSGWMIHSLASCQTRKLYRPPTGFLDPSGFFLLEWRIASTSTTTSPVSMSFFRWPIVAFSSPHEAWLPFWIYGCKICSSARIGPRHASTYKGVGIAPPSPGYRRLDSHQLQQSSFNPLVFPTG